MMKKWIKKILKKILKEKELDLETMESYLVMEELNGNVGICLQSDDYKIPREKRNINVIIFNKKLTNRNHLLFVNGLLNRPTINYDVYNNYSIKFIDECVNCYDLITIIKLKK